MRFHACIQVLRLKSLFSLLRNKVQEPEQNNPLFATVVHLNEQYRAKYAHYFEWTASEDLERKQPIPLIMLLRSL